MTIRTSIFLLLLSILFESTALGVVDPTPDRIGIYFDPSAESAKTTVTAGVPYTLYIAITNPTQTSLYDWKASVWGLDSAGLVLSLELHGGGTNSAALPDFSVAFDTPLGAQPVMLLATMVIFKTDYSRSCLALTWYGSAENPDGLPMVSWEAGQAQPYQPIRIFANGVSASINDVGPVPEVLEECDGAVASVSTSWGAVKSLYR